MKIRSGGAEMFHADGRADRRTNRFYQFCRSV